MAFSANETDLKTVENNYRMLENNLRTKLNRIERTYSGYNEYRYELADIGHDPYVLASYLTTKYDAYTPGDVSDELTSQFNSQYVLTVTPVTETRYRREPRTGYNITYDYDEDGEIIGYVMEPYTYYVRVAWLVLGVALKLQGTESYLIGTVEGILAVLFYGALNNRMMAYVEEHIYGGKWNEYKGSDTKGE